MKKIWRRIFTRKAKVVTFHFEETFPSDLNMKEFCRVLDDVARRAYERVGGSAGFRCM